MLKKTKSNTSKTRPGSVFTTLNPTKHKQVQLELFSIAEFLATSKDQTLNAKQNISLVNSQEQKLSKILAQDSTTKEKDLKPYWNDVCKAISSKLWLPTEIDFADSVTQRRKDSEGIKGDGAIPQSKRWKRDGAIPHPECNCVTQCALAPWREV